MADIEQTHFLRAFLLLVEGGTFIAKAILIREQNKSGRDLESLLSDFSTKLRHEFHGKQYQKLFPDNGVPDINTWDLQLLIGVISIIFRGTISKTEKRDLFVLKQLRNEVFMHCANVSLDEDEYEDVIEQLEDVLNELASTFDNYTKDVCFTHIKKFKCGSLDAVRPSIATINGLSQTGQQTFKVGVRTVLAVDGPSDDWKDIGEKILVTVLNNVITGSEDEDFPNVKNKVIKLLEFLSANADIVLKGCMQACILLEFECGSYEDMLHLLNLFESWKYRYYLNKIANSLTKELELNCLLTLSTRVATESLQTILIHYI
ncbi:uncharacterized protein LOC132728512, partial [Ruditapes philippinarum]|uniref:uncharacterized protein LOC132728512 n=1 Tax=Ruditapes philippinarum TaxID=129788 RepID=UPI00295BF604